MPKNRIELESDQKYSERYEGTLRGKQRAFELFYDLAEMFPNRFTRSLAKEAYDWLKEGADIGRRRFFRVVGPVRIPLTSIKQPIA